MIRARLAKARARLGRLAVIRRIDKRAKRLYKTNIWLVSSYGFAAMGVSTSALRQLRTNAAAAASLKTGGCATSTIALNYPFGSDPAIRKGEVSSAPALAGRVDLLSPRSQGIHIGYLAEATRSAQCGAAHGGGRWSEGL